MSPSFAGCVRRSTDVWYTHGCPARIRSASPGFNKTVGNVCIRTEQWRFFWQVTRKADKVKTSAHRTNAQPMNPSRTIFESIAFSLIAMTITVSATASRLAPDLIITNASIHTMDKSQPIAQAIAVAGNRIAAVGSNGEIAALAGS